MSLFKKTFLSEKDLLFLKTEIEKAERQTSGELRLYIEKKCPFPILERVVRIFSELQMEQTRERNGILIYLAYEDKKMAIWGDEGIHNRVGQSFWDEILEATKIRLKNGQRKEALKFCIQAVAEQLALFFPYDPETDTNELSDDILLNA